jgi:23S rRNA pseudouridine1911/1915/1917 synthase
MNENNIKILHIPTNEDPFVILFKPHGMPSAPLTVDDKNNALCHVADLFPEILNVHGKKEIEHGLLHRLDNDASGLLAIASTQLAYEELCKSQKDGNFEKVYSATCVQREENAALLGGFPRVPVMMNMINGEEIIIRSTFRPFGKGHRQVRPVTPKAGMSAERKSGKVIYCTKITIKNIEDAFIKVQCKITAGYRHQVRCHLAWLGLPVLGDRLYNFYFTNNKEQTLQFEGIMLSFPHPLTGKKLIFTTTDEII